MLPKPAAVNTENRNLCFETPQGGIFSKAWAEAPEQEQERMKNEFCEAFAPFAVDGGYELPPGISLCVVAS